ncbi:MAG: enolase C-terminal domain-like protein [Halanaerobium sp.]|nr:enolase C-terminal domain-like protein [Halanaerobium sp.]
MSSRILEVKTRVIEVPLKDEWKISLYSASTRRHALVQVITEDGIDGFGEASPSPAFMGETADTIKLVVDQYLAPAIEGLEVNNIARIHREMNRAILGNSAAKSAVDIAVHDAMAKGLEIPLYQIIGGKYRESIPLTYVIGIKDDQQIYNELIKCIKQGFKVIKVKVGREPERDIALVSRIHQIIEENGAEMKIRLDGNQGYDTRTAIRVINKLEERVEIEAIEQPINKKNLTGLKEIKTQIKCPLMLDETIFSPEDAINAIRMDVADVINLKIAKVGGIYQARKIAGMAEAAGMRCTVGSNLELGLGIAASLHFVASTPVVTYPSDFICGYFLHNDDLIETDFQEYIKDGYLQIPEGPGLGVKIKGEWADGS